MSENKKVSLADLMRGQLAKKKQENKGGENLKNKDLATKKLQSQQTKKPNNQRRRTGV
ncbi:MULTISPECIES: hypothetical protein [Bacillus cereus group]|uniref:DUF4023 domain-containing protein n=2 Tax=Bacillus cytotoxicus TaxID=580165 RepID=A0AAX2CL63_9BACI|nr:MULTISPECIES: hypothetical protein [Bacillus cereus group]ABS23453.1 conserved hypothetical protein [Bacillus cytotoxicus NVH 391-98]AWC30057.1 hypothetical protein CG483_018025 [Bacillus cytotoxicus]AWC34103.1 hypothetical protein CG482_017980 [Bacillus cytotoxicus]AWC38099.1 hypothetical protein CG481_017830 [Bacillus cytotoxicus]AWC42193.1 hypothetical protein CG480_018025 [Bacillus cytotoxicus]